MHIVVSTDEFRKILETASRVSTKHVTLPVLQCVLLAAEKESLAVKATNLEIGIEGSVPANITKAGTIAVPAQTLLQTINLINQKKTTLKTNGNTLTIEGGNSTTEIKSIASDEFPHIPQITENKQIINGKLFASGIQTTAFTASQSSIKPELGSVYIFQKKGHSLTFVATDSFRLMEKTVPQQGLVFSESILIPHKNALELARVIEDVEDEVTLCINENQCALKTPNIYITSRLTNGTFPDYEQIIPKEYATNATILTSDLVHALKKTNIFLNKFMQVTLSVTKTSIILSSESSEVGTTKESINASVDGEPITLNFNQRYISEVMGHIVDDSVTLNFAGIGRPMVLESVHDRSLRYLVMPMNK
jgi:DNA polymerase-3 subunit beta